MTRNTKVKRSRLLRAVRFSAVAILLLATVAAALLFQSYRHYARIVDERIARGYMLSRAGVFAAPFVIRAGRALTQQQLASRLGRAGYVSGEAGDVWNGSFAFAAANAIEIRPRQIKGSYAPGIIRVEFGNGRVSALTGDGIDLDSYALEPEPLTAGPWVKENARRAVTYGEVPAALRSAILSIEDHRFFSHSGLDLFGIGRALLRNAGEKQFGQGGSTITQQLVKNTYLSPERSLSRKFAEAMLAFTLERRLSKEEIFALYCNEIYLGQRGALGVRGVEQAARVYFGKEMNALTLGEAATIAGMIQSPARYSPIRHPELARARRNTVLGTMVRDGAITIDDARRAASEPVAIAPLQSAPRSFAAHFIDFAAREAESQLAAGSLDERSLRINTTLDTELQEIAERVAAEHAAKLDGRFSRTNHKPEVALVALDPATGGVLAMVGGRDYAASQFNRATDARRQPGSVFKPVVYATAIESGISPLAVFTDAPKDFIFGRGAHYKPANYGGGFSMQDVTMRDALIRSLNTVTVEIAVKAGLPRVAKVADSLGLGNVHEYPSLALGTAGVTPLEIASAYSAFAAGGVRAVPSPLRSITNGRMDAAPSFADLRYAISPQTAYIITDMLEGVIDHGTARGARSLVSLAAIAGKTGTSRDGWFVGYTPNLVCAVWVGFDDNEQLGLTGAEAALPIWKEFMREALTLRTELGGSGFLMPGGVKRIQIDPSSGMIAAAECPRSESIAAPVSQSPFLECSVHTEPWDPMAPNRVTGQEGLEIIAEAERKSGLVAEPSREGIRLALDSRGRISRAVRVERDARGRTVLTTDLQ